MLLSAALLAVTGCVLVPDEFNLSPLYRHRLDPDGSVRELDCLWPIFHYNKTEEEGGWQFAVRPLYRYEAKPPRDEHEDTIQEFLWPLGRVHHYRGETLARLFPIWRYKTRDNEDGERDTDWMFALLVWGGTSSDGSEDYFAFLPFYGDVPDFLTYDRLQFHLFPLHVGLTKGDNTGHVFLWPLIGFGGNKDGTKYWHRFLPFYSVNVDEAEYERYSLLWPLINWGTENLFTDDPVFRFMLFPLFGWQTSAKVNGWTFLWPFFQKVAMLGRSLKIDLFWPIFRYQHVDSPSEQLDQWWIWPFVGHTVTEDQDTWSFLWPFIWLRDYDDPEGHQSAEWFLPLYWHVQRKRTAGGEDELTKFWPLIHVATTADGQGDWRVLSPWPWRGGNSDGANELYAWLWTLAHGRYTDHSSNFDLAAHLFTTAEREGRRQTSVPFLFNYESDDGGSTLRLFQFLPIPLGGGGASPDPEREQ